MMFPDVSHHHPVKNFKVAKKYEVIISKATQGTSYVDPTLKEFVKGCEANGISYWLYAFLNKGSELEQAKFLVNTCKGIVGKHFAGYVLDVECENDHKNVAQALKWISKQSDKIMLYTGYKDYPLYKDNILKKLPKNCKWWEARYYTNKPNAMCHSNANLYQFTCTYEADGITGLCDFNEVKGDPMWFKAPAPEKKYYKKAKGATLIEALDSIRVDSSFSNRKKIAKKNGIKLYMGTKAQNLILYRLALAGKLVK